MPNTSNSCTRAMPTTPARWTRPGRPSSRRWGMPDRGQEEAAGPSWARADWPPQPSDDLTAALTGEWADACPRARGKGRRQEDRRQGHGKGRLAHRGSDQARRARQHPRADDHPRLPDPRAPRRRSRPAGHARGDAASRARPQILRLHRCRHGPPDLHRQRARPADRLHARDPRHREAHLLRHLRAAIHAHLGPRAVGMAEGADRRLRQGGQVHPRGAQGDPEQDGRGGGLREVPAREIHGHQAVRPRWRRNR